MSSDGKTEKPTDKRLRDQIKRGNVAQSREVSNFTALLALFVLVSLIGPGAAHKFMQALLPFVDAPHDIPASSFGDVLAVAWWSSAAVGGAFIAFATAVFVLGAVGAAGQGKIVFSKERIQPKLNKISPMAGVKRLASFSNLLEFAKGVAKIAAICGISAVVLMPHFGNADRMVDLPPQTVFPAALKLSAQLLGSLLIFAAVLAIFDKIWKRREWEKRLMMTKQEIKDEFKQNDGDPTLKAKRRDKARMMVKHRMMSKVPTATFILANPTHYSVALRYVPGETDAPVCVAKGIDNVALRIRKIAEDKDIPVIENPPLARALHASAELGQVIPEEHFEAVAKVVTFVMSLRSRIGTVPFPDSGD